MSFPENPEETDWFAKGWAGYKGDICDDDHFLPLNDMEAQRWWLGGFGAAWTECPDDEAVNSILYGDGIGGESVDEALARVLQGRGDLLRQLWSHRGDRSKCNVH